MDVLFPAASENKRRALAEVNGHGNSEYAVQADNGIGAAGSDGKILTNTWHRVAFAADLSATPPVLDKYIDGVKVGSERVAGLDSDYALLDTLLPLQRRRWRNGRPAISTASRFATRSSPTA